jgi:hypothetical protein
VTSRPGTGNLLTFVYSVGKGKETPSLTRDLGQIVIYDSSSLWRRAQQRRTQECTVCTLCTLWSLLWYWDLSKNDATCSWKDGHRKKENKGREEGKVRTPTIVGWLCVWRLPPVGTCPGNFSFGSQRLLTNLKVEVNGNRKFKSLWIQREKS